jgi:hypothetical protein
MTIRKHRRADGSIVEQPRFVVDFRDPQTAKRRQFFFEKRKDAEAKRAELLVQMAIGRYASPMTATVATAMQNWLEDRKPKVKGMTFRTYERAARYICGPVAREDGSIAHPGLGKIKLTDLQTAEIRRWHNALRDITGHYSANRAMGFLKAALDLAAEDFGIRPPAMPKIDRTRGKAKKKILTPEQIAKVIAAANADPERGIYVATPFDGELMRVFPTRGKRQPWPKPRRGGGGPLLYSNYRVQIWKPFLERVGLGLRQSCNRID